MKKSPEYIAERRVVRKVKTIAQEVTTYYVFERNTQKTRRNFAAMLRKKLKCISKSELNSFKVSVSNKLNTEFIINSGMLRGELLIQPTSTKRLIKLEFLVQPTGRAL